MDNHVKDLVSIDFFTVPTVRFRVLFVFLVLAHHRRRVVHFNVVANPSSKWTAQQIAEAFPFDTAPWYLLRDRDDIYSAKFRNRVRSFGIEEVLTAPRSPWQSPYVERLIGSSRRECLTMSLSSTSATSLQATSITTIGRGFTARLRWTVRIRARSNLQNSVRSSSFPTSADVNIITSVARPN